MGLVASFLERRRRRESAVPGAGDPGVFEFPGEHISPSPQLETLAPKPDRPPGSDGGPGPEEIAGLLRMVVAALRTGQFQVQETEKVRQGAGPIPGPERQPG